MLRTEELAALHRFDGAEQYFTRAVDFGFSFSIEETFEKWGRDEIIGDYVRLIRMIRPDVITRPDARRHRRRPAPSGVGGPRARGVQARRRSDEVSRADRRTACGRGSRRSSTSPAGSAARGEQPRGREAAARSTSPCYDPLLGKTYAEIGTEARSMHKCQGMAQLLALPGPVGRQRSSSSSRRFPGRWQRDERSLFDGIDTTIAGPRAVCRRHARRRS